MNLSLCVPARVSAKWADGHGFTHTKLISTPSLWAFGPRRSENGEDVGVKRKPDKSWHAEAPFI